MMEGLTSMTGPNTPNDEMDDDDEKKSAQRTLLSTL
jgi:hypothetical protein